MTVLVMDYQSLADRQKFGLPERQKQNLRDFILHTLVSNMSTRDVLLLVNAEIIDVRRCLHDALLAEERAERDLESDE